MTTDLEKIDDELFDLMARFVMKALTEKEIVKLARMVLRTLRHTEFMLVTMDEKWRPDTDAHEVYQVATFPPEKMLELCHYLMTSDTESETFTLPGSQQPLPVVRDKKPGVH